MQGSGGWSIHWLLGGDLLPETPLPWHPAESATEHRFPTACFYSLKPTSSCPTAEVYGGGGALLFRDCWLALNPEGPWATLDPANAKHQTWLRCSWLWVASSTD